MMKWLELALFVIRMIWQYGPGLWKIGKQIYDEVEDRTHPDGTKLAPEEKAEAFNRRAAMTCAGQMGHVPRRPVLNEFRENVWERKNPGRNPKPLRDARLSHGVKRKRPRKEGSKVYRQRKN